jgi:hypothetical protein
MSYYHLGMAAYWLAVSVFCGYFAAQRGRSPVEGFLAGVIFGPLGIAVEWLLPRQYSEERVDPRETEESAREDRTREWLSRIK